MNKYYTPSIEEFHVGFRYEWQDIQKYPSLGENLWNKMEIKYSTEIGGVIVNKRSDYNIRVKYLDQEDIEELGWVRNKKDDRAEHVAFNNGDYNLYFDYEKCEVAITYDWSDKFSDTIWNDIKGQNIEFYGRIKNYNELKRIMKQVGIC